MSFNGRHYRASQVKKSYLFPGVAMGQRLSNVQCLDDDILIQAALALTLLIPERDLQNGACVFYFYLYLIFYLFLIFYSFLNSLISLMLQLRSPPMWFLRITTWVWSWTEIYKECAKKDLMLLKVMLNFKFMTLNTVTWFIMTKIDFKPNSKLSFNCSLTNIFK